MAIIRSTELVAAAQAQQRTVIEGLDTQPHMLVVQFSDPTNPDKFRATRSYAAQIRRHGEQIGALTTMVAVQPGEEKRLVDVVARASDDPNITGIMPLHPLPKAETATVLAQLNPDKDVDDLLAQNGRAPTARSMIALANLGLNGDQAKDGSLALGGADYFDGQSLDGLTTLEFPTGWTSANMRMNGYGGCTNGPAREILARQGIMIPDGHIATKDTQDRILKLPEPALVFTATPVAEQIETDNIPQGSIVIDAGLGVTRDGKLWNNTEKTVADHTGVLWTPPKKGVGPLSTTYLWHHTLEAVVGPLQQMPALVGEVALMRPVQYA